LETVPGDGQTGQVLEYIYKNNPFHKVINHHINLIRVQLLDKNFRPVPVTSGETIVTLEFKHGQ
jgi:hypothetical protein